MIIIRINDHLIRISSQKNVPSYPLAVEDTQQLLGAPPASDSRRGQPAWCPHRFPACAGGSQVTAGWPFLMATQPFTKAWVPTQYGHLVVNDG